jgi:hypothetical protein
VRNVNESDSIERKFLRSLSFGVLVKELVLSCNVLWLEFKLVDLYVG